LSQSRRNKSVVTLAIGIGGLLLFNGCAGLSPLPDEKRYQFINQVKDGLDYASAGEVIEERYDNGDGVFSPSSFYVEVKGDKAFTILSERLQSLPNVDCSTLVSEQSRCNVGQAYVTISNFAESGNVTSVDISDSSSGRNSDNDK
jgi:hypothetical protein